jgi:adenylate cyclase
MESTGEIGQIQVAPDTRELIASRFELKERGIVEVRGKGPMRTWFLVGRKPAIAESSVESGHSGRSNKISDPL